SPIRRYLDLVNQRQIRNYLLQKELIYSEKMLKEIRISTEPIIKSLGIINRNRLRYWILKYLSQHRGKKFKALVLDEFKNKYRIVLTDFHLLADIKRQEGSILCQGQEISVEVKKADPWDDIINLEYIDEG
ncbi:MAG: hypothetical protein MUO68_10215, partial [Desulfobacteraceae bacterium]|nr:hypothetical protein [Desulfobacteraceae bacterium]